MNFLFENLLKLISACITTLGFVIFFNAPKRSIFSCCFIGTFGWLGYLITNLFFDGVISSLVGALCVGIMSSYASKKLFMPATIFIYTGIIPLVPGYGMYNTMQNFMMKNYSQAAIVGINTLLQAGSIAMGILIAGLFSASIARVKFERKKDKPII